MIPRIFINPLILSYIIMSQCAKLMVVTFPGKVENVDKAIECLGGMNRISSDYFKNRGPELKYQPHNPYEAATFSHSDKFEPGAFLVCKARRKKKKTAEEKTPESQVQFLGIVSKIYDFRGMCDFQFLPVIANPTPDATSSKCDEWEDLLPRLYPQDIPSSLNWFEDEGHEDDPVPLFATPYSFSRYQFPSKELMSRETAHQLLKNADSKCAQDVIGANTRNERKNLSMSVQHEQIFPSIAPAMAVLDSDTRCPLPAPHERMSTIFNQRPMWTRNAILSKSGLDASTLKTLLQKYAFYIQNGPFGRTWCKFGYDPKKSCDSREFQTLMVSFKNYNRIADGWRSVRVSSGASGLLGNATRSLPRSAGLGKGSQWIFEPGMIPPFRQMWYQLCDIKVPVVQEALSSKVTTTKCSSTTGYFNMQFMDSVREAIKTDVNDTVENSQILDKSHETNTDEMDD